MNFSRVLFFVFACFVASATVSAAPEPRWKVFKKIEKMGRNIRDGIVKAGPAIVVLGQAKALGK
ncbi:hyphancin-3F-like [Anticarsia gemmatalis]|uniref:hyphancin-3F-like n=1 Tax=Anticarsia gemmatalis TaxID=129554 RepID=UPI003F7644AB